MHIHCGPYLLAALVWLICNRNCDKSCRDPPVNSRHCLRSWRACSFLSGYSCFNIAKLSVVIPRTPANVAISLTWVLHWYRSPSVSGRETLRLMAALACGKLGWGLGRDMWRGMCFSGGNGGAYILYMNWSVNGTHGIPDLFHHIHVSHNCQWHHLHQVVHCVYQCY